VQEAAKISIKKEDLVGVSRVTLEKSYGEISVRHGIEEQRLATYKMRVQELQNKTIERNDRLRRKSELVEFEAVKPCPLTASAYLKRIMKYGGCSPCCMVVGLVYLQRLKQRNPTVCLTSANMQRLLLVSVMVAAKFLDDLYYSNKHWSQIGGLNLQEVNKLELKILFQLGFSLTVSREEYQDYLRALGGVLPSDMVSVPSFNNVADASLSFH